MNDIRSQLPECPLAYEVPFIPVNHTALIIEITAADIDWQEKMLPWTLASLINNTDLIMNGVHLYIWCENHTQDRIKSALSNFDLPQHTMFDRDTKTRLPYHDILFFDVNYWAFRDASNTHKLEIADTLKDRISITAFAYPDISEVPPEPQLYDMQDCTTAQFRHAIKHLLGAQLGMKI